MKQASWVHGNAVKPQNEGYFLSKVNYGWGATIQTHGIQWFHFAVPTPVIANGYDTTLQKVFVMFSTGGTAKVVSVQLWDGTTKIQAFDNLSIAGDHTKALEVGNNTWSVNPIHIKWGLEIAVWVDFGPPSPIGVPQINFAAAGADFLTP